MAVVVAAVATVVAVATVSVAVASGDTMAVVAVATAEVMDVAHLRLIIDSDPVGITDPDLDLTVLVSIDLHTVAKLQF